MRINLFISFFLIYFCSFSQNIRHDTLQVVKLSTTRANKNIPTTYSELSKSEIDKKNRGQDLPFILKNTPSVIVTSDAGAGVGYTGLRIRGTDMTRINVTINGIPLNDSESHGVWWVNLPDLASSTSNIQIQRGVGTSTNGAGAFGATIDLNTNQSIKKAFSELKIGGGSFQTLIKSISFGTGLLKDQFLIDGRISSIQSEGYIDRATSDLKGYFLAGTYYAKNSSLRLNFFGGDETTYQAWYGVPKSYLDNPELRTFNPYIYSNETDNYQQRHNQLFYNQSINQNLKLNFALHHTHGEGYYEQQKIDDSFSDYGIDTTLINGVDTISSCDIIRQKWLDNNFSGILFSLDYKLTEKTKTVFGFNYTIYQGKHFGDIISASIENQNIDLSFIDGYRWYENNAKKNDFNLYSKTNYKFNDRISLFGDIQVRRIDYTFRGFDHNADLVNQVITLDFINPKLGLQFRTKNNQLYVFYGIANKEPSRTDYIESTPSSRPLHETLYNTEIGYQINSKNHIFNINLYHMNYKNQLVLNGEINDVGYYRRINIDKSYRMGIELDYFGKITNQLFFNANATISKNKIKKFIEYVDNWDTWEQETFTYTNTDLAFSPNLICNASIGYNLFDNSLQFELINKYVGKQYLDNTMNTDRSLEPYITNDLLLSYNFQEIGPFQELELSFLLNNILGVKYVSNAWVYHFISEGYNPGFNDDFIFSNQEENHYTMAGYFPQATRHFLAGLKIRL